jgi:hypothetical protein
MDKNLKIFKNMMVFQTIGFLIKGEDALELDNVEGISEDSVYLYGNNGGENFGILSLPRKRKNCLEERTMHKSIFIESLESEVFFIKSYSVDHEKFIEELKDEMDDVINSDD